MTNGQIFRAAADYIREHGWRDHAAGGVDELGAPACVLGAVAAVLSLTRGAFIETDRPHPLYLALGERTEHGRVGRWNDTHNKEEVLALLDGLAFDEDLKAAAQSPLPAESHHDAIIPSLEAVGV